MTTIPTAPFTAHELTTHQRHRAIGALIGAASGDALGGPFEFLPAGLYDEVFPTRVIGGCGEMVGGGSFGWEPAEFTDDTQMALALAESLIEDHSFDPQRTWKHFVAWSLKATDIGNTTSTALSNSNYSTAAQLAHERLGQSGSNGSVMRIAPIGIFGVTIGADRTVALAREQSALTHFDETAGWGAAIVAELIRRLIISGDLNDSLNHLLHFVPEPHKAIYEELISVEWNPMLPGFPGNGSARICIAQALWSVRTTTSFEDAITTAINLGDDADTVAAVTGAIGGALYGIQQIPARWTTYLHGYVNQPDGVLREYTVGDLQDIAHRLLGSKSKQETPLEDVISPTSVHDAGIYASNMTGAHEMNPEAGIVSLCRTYGRLTEHPHRREYYIIDNDGQNSHLHTLVTDAVDAIDAFLREGREVLVHCHGGRSRTGFVLKAWYMRNVDPSHDAAHEWLTDTWPDYATWSADFWVFLEEEWMQD